MPPLFLIGGAGLVFWAQGFRFDFYDREFISTGVISVSTFPRGAGIFVNDRPRSITPDILLGVPIGETKVCLRQTAYREFCDTITVDSVLARHFHNIHLLPERLQARPLAPADAFLWDPAGRGFVLFFPDLSDAVLYDGGNARFLNDIEFADDYLVARNGKLISLSQPARDAFVSTPPDRLAARFLYDGSGYLYTNANELYLRNTKEHEDMLIHQFDTTVESAFFLPESESFIAATQSALFFVAKAGTTPIKLFDKDADFPAKFYPTSELLLWKQNGVINIFSFGAGNVL